MTMHDMATMPDRAARPDRVWAGSDGADAACCDPVPETVADIAAWRPPVAAGQPAAEVLDLFRIDTDLTALAVTGDDGRPCGLVTREALTLLLSRPYGRALYGLRPILKLADPDPLIVDSKTTLDSLETLIAEQRPQVLSTGFIITEAGRYAGIGTAFGLMQASRRRLRARADAMEGLKRAAEQIAAARVGFLAVISHELRTPLNAIIGFSDMMRSGVVGPVENARHRSYVEDIHGSAEHLRTLIDDILDAAKLEAGEFLLDLSVFDAADPVGRATDMVRLQIARKELRFEIDGLDRPLPVCADRRALQQITLNLLSNAVKFTPVGGTVTVRLAPAPAAQAGTSPASPVPGVSAPASGLALTISDTGRGIPPDALARMSDPFAQCMPADRHTGTGLGLSIVRALVDLHGGRLDIDSVLNRGTRMMVYLPAAQPAGQAAATPDAAAAPPSGRPNLAVVARCLSGGKR